MTPFFSTEFLVREHQQALLSEASRRRAVRRVHRLGSSSAVRPARAFAARVLVRTGLRLAGTEQGQQVVALGIEARARSDDALVVHRRAPVAPRRRAA